MFCSKCGHEIHDDAVICVNCGCAVQKEQSIQADKRRSWLVTLLLCLFLGEFGIHRFYTGHIGLGVLQLLTAGGCGIWTLIDFICICCSVFKDAEGNELKK